MEKIEIVADAFAQGQRIDKFLADSCGFARTLAQQLILDGQVLINGKKPPKSCKLQEKDVLQINVPPPKDSLPQAEDIPLTIVHEDDFLLVVDKPKGMVVHPAPGSQNGTLVNALLHHCGGALSHMGGQTRPGIVHRIDKDTSGLLVVAKDDDTHKALAAQFFAHSTKRLYQAVVYGHFNCKDGQINAAIGRDKKHRKKMAVTDVNAKSAITNYSVLCQYTGFAHLQLGLKTGRTHQIRVHMAQAGHPLAGDALYGPKKVIKQLKGQCLHAAVLGFVHPASLQNMLFQSPLPPYFTGFLNSL